MKQIVIFRGVDWYDAHGDEQFVVKHADPMEVSDEDYAVLHRYLGSIRLEDGTYYRMVEYIQPAEAVDILKECRKRQVDDEERAKKRREATAKQQAKQKAESLEAKRKQLEKLKKELGVE